MTYHHFKMDTLYLILKLVKKNCRMASVDLKDAYYSLQINDNETVSLIHSLGLVAHPEKSVFQPTQILVILWFETNSIEMRVKLTVEKATRLVNTCQMLFQAPMHSIRSVAKVIGYILASFPGVMFGPLLYRITEKEKIS